MPFFDAEFTLRCHAAGVAMLRCHDIFRQIISRPTAALMPMP